MRCRHPSCLIRLAAAAVLLSASAGCGRRGQAPGPAGSPPVRFAYQDRIADAASIIAVDRDFFALEGVTVHPMAFTSGPACTEAVTSGSADVGTMGDTTAIISAARAPVKIIASHGAGEHRHRIMVAGASPIRTPADLVGKRLAVKKGTSTYGGLLAWAKSAGLDLSQVRVTDLGPEDMGAALLSGAVDAAVASEPTPSELEGHGARELVTLGGLGNTYPILLMAREGFLERHSGDAEAFLRAMDRACRFIVEEPERAASIIARRTGLATAVAREAMDRHEFRLNLDATTRASLDQTATFLVEQALIDSAPDLDAAIDPRYVRAIGGDER